MNKKERDFIAVVQKFYAEHGRHGLLWRATADPYKILVSEIMLQQTQVERVIPKYRAFLKQFPSVSALANAPLGEVLIAWQGLGYNRRAKMLQNCAREIAGHYNGHFPQAKEGLVKLPGIGPYTASALMAFVYNEPVTLIETNVRSVYLHHFFHDKAEVTDAELLPLIARTVSEKNPREWYYALMDYGSYLKKEFKNPSIKSAHHVKQSAFKGSDRQIRGAIIRALAEAKQTRKDFHAKLSAYEDIRIDAQIEKLKSEGMVTYKNKKYSLPV